MPTRIFSSEARTITERRERPAGTRAFIWRAMSEGVVWEGCARGHNEGVAIDLGKRSCRLAGFSGCVAAQRGRARDFEGFEAIQTPQVAGTRAAFSRNATISGQKKRVSTNNREVKSCGGLSLVAPQAPPPKISTKRPTRGGGREPPPFPLLTPPRRRRRS